MNTASGTQHVWPRTTVVALLAINLLFGVVLWFVSLTDYSLQGRYTDLWFPVIAASLAVLSLKIVGSLGRAGGARWLSRLACMPSMVGGGLHLLGAVLLAPVALLGFIFALQEIQSETLIQSAVSPDGARVAEVYFRPVGAYGARNGHTYVRLRYIGVPFFERDVFHGAASYATEETRDYVEWRDNATLYVAETDSMVHIDRIGREIPFFVTIPRFILWYLFQGFQSHNYAPIRL